MSSPSVGHDDYALRRVPRSERYPWFSVAMQRFGQIACMSQFLLGATLGFGMDFWGAFWAFTLGCGDPRGRWRSRRHRGMREGLSTSVLARWTGFGRVGSA